MAVGGRPDDFAVSEVDPTRRGRIFDRQLDRMTSIWEGEQGIGPAPFRGSRPQLLIGGTQPKSFERVARYADGWTTGGGGPEAFARTLPQGAPCLGGGRPGGQPRAMALCYFALGEHSTELAADTLGAYCAFAGPYAQRIIDGAATDAGTVRNYLDAFAAAGADELILFPTSADPAQVDLLAGVTFG